ncbi:M20/M25/M40 family metallo-hydrolase [Deinococcus maricopensis]|uniref:Cellulase n=1 Tax=Deinococcus maricopensis (strain DSM 21211 / LMG 22137 / NRRL B-23946 / LB-34) TaxID=709986 RepID=E8UAX3_DEIML|nr:M20/M25/M40 family metallo-hydrolase [Deinococcus maricopensis]ADV68212.1 Cellulase [Deinococcus maricopensis DSM 21211]
MDLLQAAAPSGFETRAADVWARHAEQFGARTHRDHFGNAYAATGPEDAAPIVLLGHLDEIGLMVSHVGDEGLLAVRALGGWDPQVLVGQRVRLLADGGDLFGVVGKKAIHLMEAEERTKASTIKDLWVDTGLPVDEVRARIPVGTVAVIEQPPLQLGDKLASKALDNRLGAFIVLEAVRVLHERGTKHHVVAVGTAQEEIGAHGALVATYALRARAGIAVDVTHESTQPGADEKELGRVPFGSGANLAVSAMTNPGILRDLQAAARDENIPFSLSASPRASWTDADTAILTRAGVPMGVVSIPLRYMHSPSEMVDVRDVQACIDIIVAWVERSGDRTDYTR